MLQVIYAEKETRRQPGEWFKCLIMGDEELDDNYITGADVEGMADDAHLAVGSAISTPGTLYVCYTDEYFTPRG